MTRRWISTAKRLLPAFGLALLGEAEPALAFSFNINPVTLSLSGKRPSALVNLTSQSAEPVRIQITAYAWSESRDGVAKLEPTQDLVVFPPIATIPPGGKRAIRVGSTVPLGASEASYRIYVEELPPEESTPKPGEIRVLSRFGIPVFVLPLKSQPDLRLHGVEVGGGRVTVSLENHGNVHTRLKSVVMRAVDASGGLLLTRALNGWYVLAGGERRYEIPLDPDACRNASRVQVEILGDAGKLDGTAEELAGACGR